MHYYSEHVFHKLHCCFPGPPFAPLYPKFLLQSIAKAVLSWAPPMEGVCVSSYTIVLTNITQGNTSYTYNTTSNTTSMTVSDLAQGAEYSFTVAGVDAGGRVGEMSVLAKAIMFDSEFVHECTNVNAIHLKTYILAPLTSNTISFH